MVSKMAKQEFRVSLDTASELWELQLQTRISGSRGFSSFNRESHRGLWPFSPVSFNQRCWLSSVRIQFSEYAVVCHKSFEAAVMANITMPTFVVTSHLSFRPQTFTWRGKYESRDSTHIETMVHFDEDPTTFDLSNPEQLIRMIFPNSCAKLTRCRSPDLTALLWMILWDTLQLWWNTKQP